MKTPLTALLLLGLLAGPAAARTITLTAEDCDRAAVLSEKAPRLSWAVFQAAPGVYDTTGSLQVFRDITVLLRFPLDAIPKGQRITKATLTVRASHVDGGPKLLVRRVLADWGTGVCHSYRRAAPEKVGWAVPGGRGDATDRAAKVSATFHFSAAGEQTVDVTEDVELWYTGAAANHGWLMALDAGHAVYLPSPYAPGTEGPKQWKLQITYEPQ